MQTAVLSGVLLAPTVACQINILNSAASISTIALSLTAGLICARYGLDVFATGLVWGGSVISIVQLMFPITRALASGTYNIDMLSFSMIFSCMLSYIGIASILSSLTIKNLKARQILRYLGIGIMFHTFVILGILYSSVFIHDEFLAPITSTLLTVSFLCCDKFIKMKINRKDMAVRILVVAYIIELISLPIIMNAILIDSISIIKTILFTFISFIIGIIIAALAKSAVGSGIFYTPHPKNLMGLRLKSLFVPPQPSMVIANPKSTLKISIIYSIFLYMLPVCLVLAVFIPILMVKRPKYWISIPIIATEYFRILADNYYDTGNTLNTTATVDDSIQEISQSKRRTLKLKISGHILKIIIVIAEIAKVLVLSLCPFKWGMLPYIIIRSINLYTMNTNATIASDSKTGKKEINPVFSILKGLRLNRMIIFGCVIAFLYAHTTLNLIGTDVSSFDVIQTRKSVKDNMSLIFRSSLAAWLILNEVGRYAHPQELIKVLNEATHELTLLNPEIVSKLVIVTNSQTYTTIMSLIYSVFVYLAIILMPNYDYRIQYAIVSAIVLYIHYEIMNYDNNVDISEGDDDDISIFSIKVNDFNNISDNSEEETNANVMNLNNGNINEMQTSIYSSETQNMMGTRQQNTTKIYKKFLSIMENKQNYKTVANAYPIPFAFIDSNLKYVLLFIFMNMNFIIPLKSFRFISITAYVVVLSITWKIKKDNEKLKIKTNSILEGNNADGQSVLADNDDMDDTIASRIRSSMKKLSAFDYLIIVASITILLLLYLLISNICDYVIRFELITFQFISGNYNINLNYLQHIGTHRVVKGTNSVFKAYYYISRISFALGASFVFFKLTYTYILRKIPNAKLVNTELKYSQKTITRIYRFIRNPFRVIPLLPYCFIFLSYATACMLMSVDPSKNEPKGKTQSIVELIMIIIATILMNPPLFLLLPIHTLIISVSKNVIQLIMSVMISISVLAVASIYWLDILMVILIFVDITSAYLIDITDVSSSGSVSTNASLPFAVAMLWCTVIYIVYGYIDRERRGQEQTIELINQSGETNIEGKGKGLVSTLISEEGRRKLRKMNTEEDIVDEKYEGDNIVGSSNGNNIEYVLKQTIRMIMNNRIVAGLYNKCVNEKDETITRKMLNKIEGAVKHKSNRSIDGGSGLAINRGTDMFGEEIEYDTDTIDMTRVTTFISVSITLASIWMNLSPLASLASGILYANVSGGIHGIGKTKSIIFGSFIMLISRNVAELLVGLLSDGTIYKYLLEDFIMLLLCTPSVVFIFLRLFNKIDTLQNSIAKKTKMDKNAILVLSIIIVLVLCLLCLVTLFMGVYQGVHLLGMICIICTLYYSGLFEENILDIQEKETLIPTENNGFGINNINYNKVEINNTTGTNNNINNMNANTNNAIGANNFTLNPPINGIPPTNNPALFGFDVMSAPEGSLVQHETFSNPLQTAIPPVVSMNETLLPQNPELTGYSGMYTNNGVTNVEQNIMAQNVIPNVQDMNNNAFMPVMPYTGQEANEIPNPLIETVPSGVEPVQQNNAKEYGDFKFGMDDEEEIQLDMQEAKK